MQSLHQVAIDVNTACSDQAATLRSMTVDRTRKAQGERLAAARARAGWRSARAAALENGWAESSYRAHENGSRTIGQDDAETYARRFRAAGVQVSAQEILFGAGATTDPTPATSVAAETIVAGARVALTQHAQRGGMRDLPVPGIAMGGSEQDGDVRLNGEIQYFLERPAGLVGRKKAFAVILRNDSMVRSYYPGWPIFVDEDGQRPKSGDDVLIELYPDEDGEAGPAFVKTLVSRGGAEVVVTQLNPEKTIRFPADRVKQILRVIPYVEAMGLGV